MFISLTYTIDAPLFGTPAASQFTSTDVVAIDDITGDVTRMIPLGAKIVNGADMPISGLRASPPHTLMKYAEETPAETSMLLGRVNARDTPDMAFIEIHIVLPFSLFSSVTLNRDVAAG